MNAQRTLEVLLRLTADLTSDRPLEEFLKMVTDATVDLLGADHASIRLLDTTRSALLSSARSGTGETLPPMDFRRGEGVIGWVVDHACSARVDDVSQDPRWVEGPDASFRVRSVLCEPLWSSAEIIGVLSITSSEIAAFDDDDQLLLRLLANCSAPAIERARLRRLAMFDDLTLAFNHRYLMPRLIEEMERAGRSGSELSLLYMDLDHFKQVNDRYGHAAGDEVLRSFADRVQKAVRRVDVLVRRGGEEFVLIMPQTNPTQAHATAVRIQQNLSSQPISAAGHSLRQTVSIGVATWDARETPEELERRADEAMYEAKRQGRDRVVVARLPAATSSRLVVDDS